jgi:coatomer subunit beta
VAIQADDLLTFRQFSKKTAMDGIDVRATTCLFYNPILMPLVGLQYELDVTKATGTAETAQDTASNLSRVVQLTGGSDTLFFCFHYPHKLYT